MSDVTIVSEWFDGREAQHVESDSWCSASLWADSYGSVIAYWAERESAGPVTADRRGAARERARLLADLDRAQRAVESVKDALATLAVAS